MQMNKRMLCLQSLIVASVLLLAACGQAAPVATASPVAPTPAPSPAGKATDIPKTTPKPAAATPAPAAKPLAGPAFYEGKTIEMVAATGAGGGTDSTGRAVAVFLPRYIPGQPKIVVRNQPGAGGVVATNSFFEKARPDGLTLLHGSSSILANQQRRRDIVKFDFLKMPAIGNIGGSGGLLAIRKEAKSRLTDPRATPVVMATRGGEETTNLIPLFGREFLGWNVRWVTGYSGTGETMLAVRRGEVDMFLDQGPNIRMMVDEGIAEAVAQLGIYKGGKFIRRTDFPGVPTVEEILGDRKPSGLPWQGYIAAVMPQTVYKFTVAPPGTPENIMKILTDAYGRMAADPKFGELLDKTFGEVYVISVGQETDRLIKLTLDVSPEAVDYVDTLSRKFGILK
ncbi:MAG: hypothetical protein HY673_14865 [Chloroflexi bacterium]|nr:hypothetical protein [Chloroflexota bacterium]